MKQFIFFSLLFLSIVTYADQWQVLTYEQAIQAKNLLDQQKYIVDFCGCCDDLSKDIIEIEEVKLEAWEYNSAGVDFYEIRIFGHKVHNKAVFSNKVDLAYIHILKSDGLAYNVAGELGLEVSPCVTPFPHHIRNQDLGFEPELNNEKQYYIYDNEFRYPATKPFNFVQTETSVSHSDQREMVFLSIGRQEDNTPLLLLTKKFKDIFKNENESYLGGDLVLYLSNGEEIRLIDNKYYGYMEGSFKVFYILSGKDIDQLKKFKIDKIEYTINDKKSIKRFTALPQRDTTQEIIDLFD